MVIIAEYVILGDYTILNGLLIWDLSLVGVGGSFYLWDTREGLILLESIAKNTERDNIRKGCSYNWRSVPVVRDPNLSSYFHVLILSQTFLSSGGGWGISKHDMLTGGGECLKWPKKGWRHLCIAPYQQSQNTLPAQNSCYLHFSNV